MDNNSLGVLTTLGTNILVALLITGGWLLLRKCRGDNENIDKRGFKKKEDLTKSKIMFMEDSGAAS